MSISKTRKRFLSESDKGLPIEIGVANTLIHTTPLEDNSSNDADGDEVYLYANNENGADQTITIVIEDKDALNTREITHQLVAQDGLSLILPGILLGDGTKVYARGSVATDIKVSGFAQEFDY